MEKGASSKEMNLELIEEHQAEDLVFAQYNYLYIFARGHTGLCYRTNSQSTANPNTVANSNRIVKNPGEHQQIQVASSTQHPYSTQRAHAAKIIRSVH